MKFTSLLFGASLFGASVLTHPLDLPFKLTENEINNLERRQGVVATTGAAGSVLPRLEIRQMKSQQPNQFTLLILALQQWQAQSQSDTTSYYQISGIHGVPRQDWNGVGQCSTCTNADGYCTHDSVLFPAWHRAYIALFEQEFVSICKSIAASWPASGAATTKAQMTKAANSIRWPYWDWAAAPPAGSANNLPGVVAQATITVNGPNGQQTIANPLYQHKFSDPSSLRYSPFVKWPNTLRYPTSDNADATSNEASAVSAFNSIRASLQDQVYQLFTACTDYLHFSNDKAGSSSTSCKNSLEGIHNTIHTTAGGVPSTSVKTVGHMYYLSTAAFDPLFWLHHCNVDRIFAMWQTINSGSYGASQTAPHNTWTIAQGSTQNADSPLAPFYRDTSGGSFWTTNGVKDWTVFKYTYPEFANSDGSSASISNYVKKLYGPGATAKAGSSKRDVPGVNPGFNPGMMNTSLPFMGSPFGLPDSILGGLTASNGSTYEYVANIEAPRYKLGGSYWIFVFLGEPASEEPTQWLTDPNLVGPMGVLSQSNKESMDVTVSGSIPLTRALSGKLDSGIIGDLSEMIVTPLLESLLVWRIVDPNGESIDPSTVDGFEISCYASTTTQPEDGSLPQWSEFIDLPTVTHGKPGGLGGMAPIGSGSGYGSGSSCPSS